jgi:hypothetical protein
MNWTKASAIAEIVSSIAVLATLAYLAVQTQQLATQTQQNTEALQANGRQATTGLEMQLLLNQADHPEIWARQHLEDLSDVELAHLNSWLVAFFRLRELDWFNYESGVIGEDEWQSYRQAIFKVLASERSRKWWANMANVYNASFAAEVTEMIEGTPTIQTNGILDAFQ